MTKNEEIFIQFGDQLISDIQLNMDRGGVNATNKSRDSLRYEFSESEFTLYGDKSFAWIESGRAPGKIPSVDKIEEWVIAKGLAHADDERGSISIAWAIAKSIEKEGTLLFAKHKHRDVYTTVITQLRLQNLATLVADSIALSAKSEIIKAFK